MAEITDEEGQKLVKAARHAIAEWLRTGKKAAAMHGKGAPAEERGIFVTLRSYPSMELRGCMGIPEPVMPLNEAVIDASLSAAFSDPRFPPPEEAELKELVIEVSVLTKPELITAETPEELKGKIKAGKHGLIAEKGRQRGLLLPQVAAEYGLDAEGFLEAVCEKTGLPADSWKSREIKFYSFEAAVFRETEPEGNVKRIS
jgi:uncharacterized protein (TIGR00296 family)